MLAKDVMTTRVITVPPDAKAQEIARLLLENGISAMPVVDTDGIVIGMVSEGDLMGRNTIRQAEKREWWLTLLAEGEAIAPEFLSHLSAQSFKAREIMTAPVIAVSSAADVAEIAGLLTEYHIKRVPVLEDGRLVGIVSRADLLRTLTQDGIKPASAPYTPEQPRIEHALEELDKRLHTHLAHVAVRKPVQEKPEGRPSVQDFRKLVQDFSHARALREQEAHSRLAGQHREQVRELINHHVDDGNWKSVLHNAREAAERGEKEYMMLRFPNELCTDGGRAINVLEADWQNTLRGEAAEMYTRWEQELRPQGFHISARVLEYPGGFPGDIGLFLLWGHAV